jgi:hypothetical protein
MKLSIFNLSVVVLIGPRGSGKSTFARKHFLPTEVLSSDFCRGLVSDDENSQAATNDAFAVLHFIASRRLAAGRLMVIDATNVQQEARQPLVAGRKAVFVGDLVDRGPRVIDSLSLVRNMMADGSALCVPGNHDMKLLKKLRGKDVQISHGLANSLAEIDDIPEGVRSQFSKELATFLDGLVSHYALDGGRVIVAHAGMKESMQGRGSGKVREFALYAETRGIAHVDTGWFGDLYCAAKSASAYNSRSPHS